MKPNIGARDICQVNLESTLRAYRKAAGYEVFRYRGMPESG